MNQIQEQFYQQLDKLDSVLIEKSPNERAILGFLVGVGIIALMYFGVYDLISGYKAEYQGMHSEINDKIAKERDYISSMDNGGFLSLEQQISNLNEGISQSQETIKHLNGLLNDVFDNSKDWFLTFDEASKKALDLGLVVNGTDIELGEAKSLGGMKHSTFILFGSGKYNKILEYIDWLETFGQFVSLDSIIIESRDNRLTFSILIRNFRGGV